MTSAGEPRGADRAGVPPALAERIARDLSGSPPPRVSSSDLGRRLAGTLLAAQAGAAVVAFVMGVRPAAEPILVLPALVASAALLLGGLALGREAIPGRGPAAATWGVALGLGAAVTVALAFAQASTAPEGPVAARGTAGCLVIGALLGLLPMLVGSIVVRRGHAVRPRAAGLVLGALAALVGLTTLHLHCPDVSWAHAGPMHCGVVGVLGGLGAYAGGRMTQTDRD